MKNKLQNISNEIKVFPIALTAEPPRGLTAQAVLEKCNDNCPSSVKAVSNDRLSVKS